MFKRHFISLLSLLLLLLTSQAQEMPRLFTTNQQASGNKWLAGSGTFPNVTALDIALSSPAQFVIATVGLTNDEALFFVTTQTGMEIVSLNQGQLAMVDNSFLQNASVSPVFAIQANPAGGFLPMWSGGREWNGFAGAPYSHLLPLENDGNGSRYLGIGENGDLVYFRLLPTGESQESRLSLRLAPDARIVRSQDGLFAVYTHATNERYVHGIMGDDLEGSSLLLFRVQGDDLMTQAQLPLVGDAIYEGLYPLWADVNGDGLDDLIATVSDAQVGSRIRVYLRADADAFMQADGLPIGEAQRWQHQLAFAPFGVNGEMELVDVLTPHIGGIVRFYRFDGTSLQISAQLAGYTSHVMGSRNVDMAIAGDFNGDGQTEIVLPSQDRQRLAGIQHMPEGALVAWEVPVNGTVVSNLAAVNLLSGRLLLAAGTEQGNLRVWLPSN